MNDGLKALIDGDCDLQALRQRARSEGMRDLRENGLRKVAAGMTTMIEVERVSA